MPLLIEDIKIGDGIRFDLGSMEYYGVVKGFSSKTNANGTSETWVTVDVVGMGVAHVSPDILYR